MSLTSPQYVEFSGFDAEDGENDSLQLPDPNAQKANQQQAKSLEALLSVKNKKLLEELTRFRVSSTHMKQYMKQQGLSTYHLSPLSGTTRRTGSLIPFSIRRSSHLPRRPREAQNPQ